MSCLERDLPILISYLNGIKDEADMGTRDEPLMKTKVGGKREPNAYCFISGWGFILFSFFIN